MTDIVFDGGSLYARAYFGTKGLDAVNVALQMTLSILNPTDDKIGEKINRTLFCWDGRNARDKGRAPKAQEYYDQREEFKAALTQVIGTQHALLDKYEADDLVASAVYSSKSDRIYVVSDDKDLLQLHGGTCSCYKLSDKALMTSSSICLKWGVKRPSHIAIALAVIGDAVDNIHGIPRWGPAAVRKLFKAVTKDMEYQQVFDTVLNQIPLYLQESFLISLDQTLLRTDLDVPEPAPLAFSAECDRSPAVDSLFYRVRSIYGS